MDEKVAEQLRNVASLPGIVRAAYAMPDAHWGYGFPVGGVGAFDADDGGVISAGGVGFDVSCGVRNDLMGLTRDQIISEQVQLADALYREIPAGLGSHSAITLDEAETAAMLLGGARWAIERGYGRPDDLERIEERGCSLRGGRAGEGGGRGGGGEGGEGGGMGGGGGGGGGGGRGVGADPAAVSDHARKRQRREMGTLGSGNHLWKYRRSRKSSIA